MAQRAGLDIRVDVYEPRDFANPGPAGCNMCGGVISESLGQMLASEGISLPASVVQRGIDSYVLHMVEGDVKIETPRDEKRIVVVHRGAAPRGTNGSGADSFDSYVLKLVADKGAHILRLRVDSVTWERGRPQVSVRGIEPQTYDLLVVAVGVKTCTSKLFEGLGLGYKPPKTTKTWVSELYLGQDAVERCLGSSLHVFLLNLPRLEFGALVPKIDYATMCLIGHDIDREVVQSFLDSAPVKRCLPSNWQMPQNACHCSPNANIGGAFPTFANRIVFIGDCGVTRLYKDGIGTAYRAAKTAAATVLLDGVSSTDFRRRYRSFCQDVTADNHFGELIFFLTRFIQMTPIGRRGVLRMVNREQHTQGDPRRMSAALWDIFAGRAPYREVFARSMRPAFLARFLWEIGAGTVLGSNHSTHSG